jgi:Trm5-related predicted tRNA methylase
MHAYGSLRKSQRPVKVHFTSFRGAAAEALRRVSGAEWKVFRHEEPFHQVFDKSKLVYLSPDAPDVLDRLKAEDIYVIGGLVDDNKLLVRKNRTLKLYLNQSSC